MTIIQSFKGVGGPGLMNGKRPSQEIAYQVRKVDFWKSRK